MIRSVRILNIQAYCEPTGMRGTIIYLKQYSETMGSMLNAKVGTVEKQNAD